MSQSLFQHFEAVTSQEWKQRIQAALKGADYTESLVWESLEGIKVKPFYHADETEYLGIPTKNNRFAVGETIEAHDLSKANTQLQNAVQQGVEVFFIQASKSFDLDVLLHGVKWDKSHKLYFQLDFLSKGFVETIFATNLACEVGVGFDPIGHLIKKGNWYYGEEEDMTSLKGILKEFNSTNIFIDSSIFHNAGSNIVQQLAYTFSIIKEYIEKIGDENISKFTINFGTGGNYFFEIAKLRVFRYLWKEIKEEYKLNMELEIVSTPGLRNKTIVDYNNNILRTTTEHLSAILGGADVCCSLPYDKLFKEENGYSTKIAENQLNVLKHEIPLEDVNSIATGSYYIESLTIELAYKVLDLMKLMETSGGFLKQFYSGKIQKKIRESAKKEQDLYDKGEIVLIGGNKYVKKDEVEKSKLTTTDVEKRKTTYEVLPIRRLEK